MAEVMLTAHCQRCVQWCFIMKILLSWLSDYIETSLSAEQLAEVLSDLGFPCDGIERLDGDAVIDVEITSNRGDCLGYIGIARELAAATGKELKIPQVRLDESNKDVTDLVDVEIAEPDLCGRYTARVIEGVKIGPGPDWMRKRLEAIDMRSVNNVVDATNYAMMETGQPPHAFDYAKITDGKIIVRKAHPGERIISIDESRCDLAPDMLIIADANGPVAVAGVMGGLDSEVGEDTGSILLEDAYFDPVSVRGTLRKLALSSEAAFRFERNVDIEAIDRASKRTAQLITQVAGGRTAAGVVDIYPRKPGRKQLTLRPGRLNELIGIEIPAGQAVKILAALGFNPQQNDDAIICTVPSWRRGDVCREVDLIEEVARVYGYDKVPINKRIEIEVAPVDSRRKVLQMTGTYLNAAGFYETVNVSFNDKSTAELFAETKSTNYLSVKDESRKSANMLRQTLIGSLLGVLRTNLNAGNQSCRIFEVANTFVPAAKTGELPIEKTKIALVCETGLQHLRGVIEGLVKTIAGDAELIFAPAGFAWAQAGAQVIVNGKKLGCAGVVSQGVNEKFDFRNLTVCAAELDFEMLFGLESPAVKVKPIPKFPAIARDLSLVVDESVKWSQISEAVDRKAPKELEKVSFVGIYRGKGIPDGQKSVTLTLRFRDLDGTLTHETADGFEQQIIKSLTDCVGAQLRTI